MILRKPYAFLIKNFKKIHMLLSLFMVYIAYKSNNILVFFNNYISNTAYSYNGNIVSKYVNIYIYIVIIIIVMLSLIIYILMRQKKKPTLLYLSIIIFYLLLAFGFFEIYNQLTVLEINIIDPQLARVIRDVTLIFTILEAVFTLFIIVRAVGFDIKKFNFGEDLQKLEIDVTDNEEFELTVGVDSENIERKIRHRRRELKYFVLENAFILSIIGIVVVATTIIVILLNVEVYNKVYDEGETFRLNDFAVKVNNSYITHNNYQGEAITKDDYVFVIVNFTLENKDTSLHRISLKAIKLFIGKNSYDPVTERYPSFFDLGVGYVDQRIKGQTSSNYILVFKIPNEYATKKKMIRYTESAYFSNADLVARYKKVRLISRSLDGNNVVSNADLGDDVTLNESLFRDSSFKINDFKINSKFIYETIYCIQNECNEGTKILFLNLSDSEKYTLLRLVPIYTFDSNISYMKINDFQTFISSFAKLKYIINNKIYYSELEDKTPYDYTGNDTFFEVSKNINNATSIDLLITIRNKQYLYNLK